MPEKKGQVFTIKTHLLSTIMLVSGWQKNSQQNKGIISLTFKKCIAVLRRSCAITQCIVRQSHSPLHVKPLEAGEWGRSWCLCFLKVVQCVVVVCWEMAFCACSDFVTHRWCLARIWIKSTICRVWYEHTLAFVWKSDSDFFSFNLSQHLFLSVCNLKSGQRKMFRIC